MDSSDAKVLLIDDDADVRGALTRLLRSVGWEVVSFASAEEFLLFRTEHNEPSDRFDCLVLDIRMPGASGPELHSILRSQGSLMPVIYLSGYCDIRISVDAMKLGATNVLEKPADADLLLRAIADAAEQHRQDLLRRNAAEEFGSRLGSLSPREREVMNHVVVGRLNKQIASELGIAEKTVKVHRGRMMAKMRVRSVADLVHQCDQFGLADTAVT